MNKMFPVAVALCLCVTAPAQVNSPTCTGLSYTRGPITLQSGNGNDHITGGHGFSSMFNESCSYTGGPQSTTLQPCTARSTTTPTEYPWENGLTKLYQHVKLTKVAVGGNTGAAGATAASDGEGAMSVTGCLFPTCSAISITITGSGNGAGFGVTFGGSGTPLEEDKHHDGITCNAYTLAPLAATGSTCPYPIGQPTQVPATGYTWDWNTSSCTWQQVPLGPSPIAVDTKGSDWKGELFSDPRKGDYVTFDILGNGHPMKLSWPKPESGVAWLVMPDADGNVKDASQIFGDHTPHSNADFTPTPNNHDPNGFLALAFYDQLAQGGNGNALLDKGDAVFSKLRLWFPKHCFDDKDATCQSLPGELATLESEGITSISLVYDGPADITDHAGNRFRWWSYLNPDAETIKKNDKGESCCDLHRKSTKDGRRAIDVYLMVIP